MVKLKCPCGHIHKRKEPEDGRKIECPKPGCNNDGIWSDGDTNDFTVL
jgi:hypothetical protein